jgi:hypothetical protein
MESMVTRRVEKLPSLDPNLARRLVFLNHTFLDNLLTIRRQPLVEPGRVLLKNKERQKMPPPRVMTKLQSPADDDSKRKHRRKRPVLRKLKPVETARNLPLGNHFVKDPLRMAHPAQPPSTLPISPLSTQT